MYLRPRTFVAEVTPGRLQVGSTPPHTVVFSDLSAREVAWVRGLRVPLAGKGGSKERRPRVTSESLTARQREILRMLDAADLLTAEPSPLSSLHVQVIGLDAVGIQVARFLAEEGVKTLELRDRRRVDASIERFFDSSAPGRLRQTALADSLRVHHRAVRIGASGTPDLTVVCGHNTWDHGAMGRLISEDLAHLPIVERDREVQVGPVIVPGRTGCALCIDLSRQDAFPLWARTSLALAGTRRPHTPDYLSVGSAGLAVSLIICSLTGTVPTGASRPPGLGGASHSFTVSASGVTTQEWFPHPACACHADGLLSATSAA